MKIVKKFKFNDVQISAMQALIEKHNDYRNIYIVLGELINKIIANSNENRIWEDNEFTNIFKDSILKHEHDIIKDEYSKRRSFPLIPEVMIHARLLALNQVDFSKKNEITNTDVLMAHYFLLIVDHKIEKEKFSLPFDSKIDYRIALHIEPLAIPDNPKYEERYETLQICNYFFKYGEKDFAFMVYCASVLLTWAEKSLYIDMELINNCKFHIDPIILSESEQDFANLWKYMFVLRDSKIYFPLGKLSLIYMEHYVKSLIVKREVKNGRNPNIVISMLWTRRKEFMLERLILKNRSATALNIYSENSIRKNENIFSNRSKHDWMGKKALFTPDIMIDGGSVWYIFDLKIIYMDSKYFSQNNDSYSNTIKAHVKSIRKLMNFIKNRGCDIKIEYFVSNALVHSGEVFGIVMIGDINDEFLKEYNRPVPKRICLHYISLKRLEHWFGSKDMKLANLFSKDYYLEYMVPATDLMTDEMDEFFKSKLNKELLYGKIENEE